MNIIYENEQIVDVELCDPILQERLTLVERSSVFGCAQPDPDVMDELNKLKRLGTGSREAVVNAMVSAGLITQQRADIILQGL